MIRHSAAFLCLHTCYRMFLTRSISPEHAPSLPWPPCSLLCYGILARKTLGSSYPASHLGTLVRVLQCVGAWAWILKDKVEQEGHPPPGRASHTHLHAGVEGPVHLGLDIHHLADTEERKAGGKPSRGTKGGQEPQMPTPLAFLRLRLVQNHEQRPSLLRVPFSHPHQPGPASERSRTGLGLPHHWSLPPHNPMQIMDFPCLSAKGSCVVNRTRGQAEGPAAG